MKKVVFILVAFLSLSMSNEAQAQSKLVKALTILASFPPVDVQFGENKVINGQRFECIDSGICRIRVGRMANWAETDFTKVKPDTPTLAIDKEGDVFLVVSDKFTREEFLREFTIGTNTEMDTETLEVINEVMKRQNSKAERFEGLKKGKTLKPYTTDGLHIIKLN